MPKFVITGASGGGKSTLIAALSAAGYSTVPEAGRTIVREQAASGGDALPWADRAAFMDLLFARSVAAFDAAPDVEDAAVFFDRSFIEAIAYGAVIGRPPPTEMLEQARARVFSSPVFACPPWREIFETDGERQHDFNFAERDYRANIETYRAFGYEPVEIPRLTVEERKGFVLNQLEWDGALQPSNPSKNH